MANKPGNPELCTYRVIWSHEDGEYVGLCTEFPSLSWLAPTRYAAMRGIHLLVRDVIDDLNQSDASLVRRPIRSRTL